MSRTLKTMSLLVGGFVLLSFGVVVINQTAGVVDLAGEVHPSLGKATLVGLLALYAGLIGVPVVLFVRLPKSLDPPSSEQDPEFPRHLEALRCRLKANPMVTEADLSTRDGLGRGIAQLDARADEIIRQTAGVVFLSTAISQNGKLDGAMVLAVQSRMIWQLAHLYTQRPTAKDMTRLYANVAGTAFVVGAINEVDLSRVIEPVLTSTLGSMAGGAIPAFQVASNVLVNSVMSGTANAYLTLRVGMIAKRYCGAIVVQPKPALRRAASAEAAKLLGGIVRDGTAQVSGAVWAAVRGKGLQTYEGVRDSVRTTVTNVGDSVRASASSAGEYAKGAGDRFFRLIRRGSGPGPIEPGPAG